jgi:hypothetical protein
VFSRVYSWLPLPNVTHMGTYMIQRMVGGADVAGLGYDTAALRTSALAMTAQGHPVQVLSATYIPNDQTWLCVVDGDDAASVIETLKQAGTTTARVLPALSL